MGKRTKQEFDKRPRDYYGTIDPDAVKPLIPFVKQLNFAEPCSGNGDLVELLEPYAICKWESDIEPQNKYINKKDALMITRDDLWNIEAIITNPPFSWELLKPLLDHLPKLKPTWLLLPADVMHNKRMSPYMETCEAIVSVGRLYWMDNKVKGVDNYCWFLFQDCRRRTHFYGRDATC